MAGRTIRRILCLAAGISLLLPLEIVNAQTVQNTVINGQITDHVTGEPLAYATVTLTDADMKPLNAVAADMTGRFSLAVKTAGDLKLVVSHTGYTSSVTDITIREGEKKMDAGTIKIVEGEELEGISVVIQKPLIKIEPDKLVYSVEADPEKDYSTLAEILRKVPQLSLDAEEKVLLNGQGNYKVLVDGKSSSMLSKNFNEVIKSLPANSIKDIEIITEPSTKYEAEGVAGIINIITNNKRLSGYNGRVGGGVSSFGGYDASAYIASQIGKFTVSLNYWGGVSPFPEDRNRAEFISYNNPDSYRQATSSKGGSRSINHGLWAEASYEIDTFNLISMSAQIYAGKYSSDFLSQGSIYDIDGELRKQYEGIIGNADNHSYITGSVDYQRTFKKPGKTFTVSYLLEAGLASRQRWDYIDGILDYPPRHERSYNESDALEHTLQVDYVNPFSKKHSMEAGFKYILRLNDSDIDELKLDDDGEWAINPDRLGGLDYTQNILGVYGGYMFSHKKLTAKAGFRIEGTWNSGNASAAGESIIFDNSNLNFVPYANLTYMLKSSRRIRLSYTQRLGRPGIAQLNPYVQKDEYITNMIRFGNPELKTVVSHRVSTAYSIFSSSWNMELSASAAFSGNDIRSYIFEIPGTNEIASTYGNIGEVQNYFLNASFGYRLNTMLNVNVNTYASYAVVAAPSLGVRNDGFSGSVSGGSSVALWKDARLNFNAGIYIPGVDLQTRSSAWKWSALGMSQRLFKQKVDLALYVSNPFRKMNKTTNTTFREGHFSGTSVTEYNARKITFRAGFRFGKMDASVKKVRRTISNDDKISDGGSGGK